MPFVFNHSCVALALCLGSLYCWHMNFLPSFSFFLEGWSRFSCDLPLYVASYLLPSTLASSSGFEYEKHPQTTILPPLYFTVNWLAAETLKLAQIQRLIFDLVTLKKRHSCTFIWPFVNNGFFLATPPNHAELLKWFEMVVWCNFMLLSVTVLCNSFWVTVGLNVAFLTSLFCFF